ncbi:acyltransferase domain-containing protein [Francisella sp. 19X1-34]|uniref:acyltransferase domain-containing protein n=1 Tax=Francisella sp. 19X1-34 TaxID=3087177 RepID=UPI002E36395E|nr:acyltransferase domain-containing protein [Francisella sp. 19X1-34]MED7787625.1 acyltransferase domain-containing protein [Francisella sp. 19X1-34]
MAIMYAFSGQGLQNADMFKLLSEDERGVVFLEEASKLVDINLLNKNEFSKYLFDQKFAQLFITILSKGIFDLLSIKSDSGLCGYSLGEAIAFICSTNLSLDKALDLVSMRARFMLDAIDNDESKFSMMSVKGGLDVFQIKEVANKHKCELAICLSDTHAVIAGLNKELEAFANAVKELGAKFVKKISVNVPSHTHFLKDATPKFASYLKQYDNCSLQYPIIDSLTLSKNYSIGNAIDCLARELSTTLQFGKLSQCVLEYGYSNVVEIGPGFALKNIFNSHNAYTNCLSCNDFSSLNGLRKYL